MVAAFSSLAPPLLQTGGVLAQDVAQIDEFLFEGGELAQRVLPSKKGNFNYGNLTIGVSVC